MYIYANSGIEKKPNRRSDTEKKGSTAMHQRLREVLCGEEQNYILPFFWQHGEDKGTLRHYMQVIHDSNIRAVCVESRPHPDFLGEKWWEDMDTIIEEAKRLDMKVWVLDDAHFPTGYCNGRIVDYPEYGKVFLDHYTIDVCGPDPYASFLIKVEEGERCLGVVALRRREGAQAGRFEAAIDITSQIRGELVSWAVPEGYWNIVVIKTTRQSSGRKNYCNLIDRGAVQFFLDTVYKPHWEHYRELFGTVFAGFFSDEPELGNTLGEYPDSGIGQPTMALPWCEELWDLTGKVWGDRRYICLAALWCSLDMEDEGQSVCVSSRARYEYMNMVTDLYGKNFCGQVGEWCDRHGVEYIGHVIEDNGNHARTGYGAGHFFKALWGQQMAGIDVVLQQIRPGYDDKNFYHIGGKNTYNGTFFHYGLAKMGSSLAHLDRKKKGRTMCEVYGAYGWSEGLKLMKWLADHMLVRGVNWFVPHAFTPAEFPDPDCPPHFYAQGKNPQYPWFSYLMRYMNRMSHLLNGGEPVVRTAVLYTAELQWIGSCTPFEEIGKLLMRCQIDYEVVPIGLLAAGSIGEDGRLSIGGATYSVLIVPECQAVPSELMNWVMEASKKGLIVLFAGERPSIVESEWDQTEHFFSWQDQMSACMEQRGEIRKDNTRAPLFLEGDRERLFHILDDSGVREVRCTKSQPWLRCYHYRQEGESSQEFYLFFQEEPYQKLEEWIVVEGVGDFVYWYDGWENCLKPVVKDENGRIFLALSPYETRMLCVSKRNDSVKEQGKRVALPAVITDKKMAENGCWRKVEGDWRIALRGCEEDSFGSSWIQKKLENITALDEWLDFSGTIRYETELMWDVETESDEAMLDCGAVFETMEVWLNGRKQGVRIAPPYCVPLKGLTTGSNHLVVYVANTLVHKLRDKFSVTMPVEASGLLGPVRIAGCHKII